ncbi:YheU family protein [Bdellovibrio bacteriovorus]|uniref:YheU family protein n=1 Tax=Bdellovibrio bacteriovorus TaxID=959 RepID=UPI0035A72DBC
MNDNNPENATPIEIPKEALSEQALRGVIDNFIQREGTDYGVNEVSYETKMQQVQKQIDKGHVRIVFDPNTETVSLMPELEWKKFQKR